MTEVHQGEAGTTAREGAEARSDPLRIDFVSSHHPSEDAMGLAHIVSWLSREMSSWGNTVRVFYPIHGPGSNHAPPTRDEYQGVEAIGVPTPEVSRTPFGPENAFSRRVASLLKEPVDVVVVNNEQGGAHVVERALRLHRANGEPPLAVDVLHGLGLRFLEHGREHRPPGVRPWLGYFADRRAIRRLEGGGARNAEVCIACSRAVKEDLVKVYGVDPRRVFVIYNGVDARPLRTPEDRDRAREKLGLGHEELVLTFLGRDHLRKGLDVARKTVALLRKEGLPLTLLNAGNNEPASDGVRALGSVPADTKDLLMDACDAFFLPTHYEGFPAVVQEASARGVPVVTTKEANVELGANGVDFVAVDPNTPEAHAAALRPLLQDRDALWEMGVRGRQVLGTRSYESQAREYLDLFRRGLAVQF
jgi:glycosyltransferase involved in cell wall biosynthesis